MPWRQSRRTRSSEERPHLENAPYTQTFSTLLPADGLLREFKGPGSNDNRPRQLRVNYRTVAINYRTVAIGLGGRTRGAP